MIGEIVASDKCARLRCCRRRERARACTDLTTRLLYLARLRAATSFARAGRPDCIARCNSG